LQELSPEELDTFTKQINKYICTFREELKVIASVSREIVDAFDYNDEELMTVLG